MPESKYHNDQKVTKETKGSEKSSALVQKQYRYQDLETQESKFLIEEFKTFLKENNIKLEKSWPINHIIVLEKRGKTGPNISIHLLGFVLYYWCPFSEGLEKENRIKTIVIQEILKKGADPNIFFFEIVGATFFPTSPLVSAINRADEESNKDRMSNDHSNIILPLLESGANVNIPAFRAVTSKSITHNYTIMPPLLAAMIAFHPSKDTLRALIRKGANLKASTLSTYPHLDPQNRLPMPAKTYQLAPLDELEQMRKSRSYVLENYRTIAPVFYSEIYQHFLKLYVADFNSRAANTLEVFRSITSHQKELGLEKLIRDYIGSIPPVLQNLAQNYLLGQGYSLENDNLPFYIRVLGEGQRAYEAELKAGTETKADAKSAIETKTKAGDTKEQAQETKTVADTHSTAQAAGKSLTFSGAASSAASAAAASATSASQASPGTLSAGLTSTATTQITLPQQQQQQQQQDKKSNGSAKP